MDPYTLIVAAALGFIIIAVAAFLAYNRFFNKPVETMLMSMAGELKLTYYPGSDGKPPFATGTYSGRGVTLDLVNEKGYFDRWHPHSRIIVSVDKNIKETYIVAKRGRFYSRKLGEVTVKYNQFDDKYVFLASSTTKGERLMNPDLACWIMNLDIPFVLLEGHIQFHQDKLFDQKERTKHIIDALVYIANVAEKIK
jgi:hypothetical protein